jgi:two-component system, chemotaxis family, CheB/CheR fusion protein
MELKPPGDVGTHAEEPESAQNAAETTEDATSAGVRAASEFPIVGIGASAGGLEALELLTSRLPLTGMAFVVVQHLAAGHESTLQSILARGTPLQVQTVEDGMSIEPDHIYVAPAMADVAVRDGLLHLIAPLTDRRGPRLSVDAFLQSLAADRGARAIGVILSGAGADGTHGLKAINEVGGITFVQEPSTASQSSMPQSALDAGCADFCLNPAAIADELVRLAKHPYVVSARPGRVFDDDVRNKLFILLRNAFGVDFSAYKQPTIERRIQRRMALHKLEHLGDYLKYVMANASELNILYSDLLIGVTGFFRDGGPFESLKTLVFPQLLEHRTVDEPIRIWVAGCATGEEVYSIAMLLLEYLEERAPNYRLQLFATDIAEHSLTRARLAVYPRNIELEVAPERLQRFFLRTDKGYQVHRTVRDMVVFARHNLAKDPPFSRIDLVSCRNVLIYMQPALQKKVLRFFHYALNPNGFLLLGTSESVGDGSDLFALVDRKTKLYSKKDAARASALDFALGPRPDAEPTLARARDVRPAISVLQLADRKVLEQYGPPGVVVNETFDILQYRGKTGRFFEPAPGIASVNLLKLARPELLPELRSALHRALTEDIRVLSAPIQPWRDADFNTLRLDVTPLPDAATIGRTFLVLFTEQTTLTPAELAPPSDTAPVDARVHGLERELATTKEYLQTTIENYQATNEELQSSNEELQSSNEELQSTNEELETSKEELQSTNEELLTLNEELHNRMAQLNVTSDDLQNVFASANSAMLLVGRELRIRRFSSAAEKLLNLIPGDVGRPLAYLRGVIKARDIEQTVATAIDTTTSKEQKVRCADGYWYMMYITPYRTVDHVIRGAVIEFVRATAGESAEPADRRALERAIVASLPQALALLDDKQCISWANRVFLELFDVGPDVFGRPFEDLWGGKSEQPEVWKLLDAVTSEAPSEFRRLATAAPFQHPPGQRVRFSVRRLAEEDAGSARTLVMIEEDSAGEV